jgi:hypothetical protein
MNAPCHYNVTLERPHPRGSGLATEHRCVRRLYSPDGTPAAALRVFEEYVPPSGWSASLVRSLGWNHVKTPDDVIARKEG